MERTTFCYPDSYLNPSNFGVAGHMGLIALAEAAADYQDVLDNYIEAHIHPWLWSGTTDFGSPRDRADIRFERTVMWRRALVECPNRLADSGSQRALCPSAAQSATTC
ncbi:hypothetical protein [Nocardia goodfellowii]|uniref:Uncharacterized protein n=1 Tax=Nocardia goodfellowii TaxID=882446 RepID=A0ABS4QI76_9NOCA|nr:hypothetical protein [Nocardia goodfellowii]